MTTSKLYKQQLDTLTGYAALYGFASLRLSLGITFVWFGMLKLMGTSPVESLVLDVTPPLLVSLPGFYLLLSLFEVVAGIALIANKFTKETSVLIIGHLIMASGFVLLSPVFNPAFPQLTLEGEFVVKNAVLVAAAFALLAEKTNEQNSV